MRECRPGMEWEQKEVTCIVPSTLFPCRSNIHNPLQQQYLYAHQCDPHKYIHCDANGQSFVQDCQLDYLFYPASETCIPIGFPGSESLVYTCNGAYQTYVPQLPPTTTPAQVQGTVSGGGTGYIYSSGSYHEPCTRANIAANKLYFPYKFDRHHYIQCDLFGNMFLRDCSDSGRDYYDPYTFTCVDGPVTPEPVLGGGVG